MNVLSPMKKYNRITVQPDVVALQFLVSDIQVRQKNNPYKICISAVEFELNTQSDEFEPNTANFIKTTDTVQKIQQLKL